MCNKKVEIKCNSYVANHPTLSFSIGEITYSSWRISERNGWTELFETKIARFDHDFMGLVWVHTHFDKEQRMEAQRSLLWCILRAFIITKSWNLSHGELQKSFERMILRAQAINEGMAKGFGEKFAFL